MSSLARWAPRANRVPTGSERRRDGGLSRSDFLPAVGGGYAVACCTRGVAQFGSALRSGRRGRGFKSRHPDDEDVRELARETSEEEGVAGRQAEYPDDEDVRELARETSEEEGVAGRQAEYPDDEDVRELARETSEEEGVERPKA